MKLITLLLFLLVLVETPLLAGCGEDSSDDVSDPIAIAPVTTNGNWTPVIQEFDGFQMALVPPGCFMMGSSDGYDDERPMHEVCFQEPFWIDVYEVTNAQYGGPASHEICLAHSVEDDQPRNCVTWYEAQAFCEGRGGSLPSEAQWEYVARGPESWVYPWGNDFVGDHVVYEDNGGESTAEVGSRPGGVSWVGVYDLLGNVSEWTTTIDDRDQYLYPYSFTDGRDDVERTDVEYRVLRGGNFVGFAMSLRAA